MANQFIGRRVSLGVAREVTRGTWVSPTIWMSHTALTYDTKADKVISEEAFGNIDDSDQSFVVDQFASGDVEGEIKDDSFGFFLYGMLGSLSTAGAGPYTHTFTESNTNNHQSLAFTVDDPIGDVGFPLVCLDSLTVSANVGEVSTFSSSWMSKTHLDIGAGTTPSFPTSGENKFTSNHVTLELADTTGDLGGSGTTYEIKSAEITFSKNLLKSNVLGTAAPEDFYNQQFSVEGTIELDYTDRTWRDFMTANTYKSMRLQFVNTGVTLAGGGNPTFYVDLSRAHFFDWEAGRPLNEVSTQTVSFKGLYNVATGENIVDQAVLINGTTSY